MERKHIVVSAADAGERLDRFLRRKLPGPSRSALSEQLAQGLLRVNGRRARKGQFLQAGDEVQVAPEAQRLGPVADHELRLRVLHEDAYLVVVDKPAGVPSHALRPGESGNVASALLARYPEMEGVGHRALEPGLVHRLDTETSGVLLAARSAEAFEALHALHALEKIDKVYVALCVGQVHAPQTVTAFLDASTRKVRIGSEWSAGAREIKTSIESVQRVASYSLVTLHAVFAARHQVRAQLAALGHPIVGDLLYGGPELAGLHRHFLHASCAELTHPRSGQCLKIEAPLPSELTALLAALLR